MFVLLDDKAAREPWNKGKLIGQKKPLKLKEVWTIRVRLQLAGDVRGLRLCDRQSRFYRGFFVLVSMQVRVRFSRFLQPLPALRCSTQRNMSNRYHRHPYHMTNLHWCHLLSGAVSTPGTVCSAKIH